jgi:hypothetical protein
MNVTAFTVAPVYRFNAGRMTRHAILETRVR